MGLEACLLEDVGVASGEVRAVLGCAKEDLVYLAVSNRVKGLLRRAGARP